MDRENLFADLSAEEEAALSPDQPEAEAPPPAPEPKPEPAPEREEAKPPEPDERDETDLERPPEKHVPHGALHAERERRKAVEAELAEMREWRKTVEAKLNPPTKAPEDEDWPDPVIDPKGFAERQRAEAKRQSERFEQFQQRSEAERTYQTVATQEAQFRAATPDYDAALAHLVEAKRADYAMAGYGEAEIGPAIDLEAGQIARRAVQAGRNPAEVVYGMAKARGFGAKPTAPAQPDEATRLERIAAASRSVGAAAGSGGGAELTLEDVAAMSPEEIMALSEHERRRIMGG